MNNKAILALAIYLCFGTSTAQAYKGGKGNGYQGKGFPAMQSSTLNSQLSRALGNMGCWVEEHLGVQGNAAHQKTASCHNRGLAIDIKRLGCEGSRARYSNDENLRYLARSLGAWFGFVGSLTHTICYKDIGAGFCRGGHGGHLHFGAKEGLGCPGFL